MFGIVKMIKNTTISKGCLRKLNHLALIHNPNTRSDVGGLDGLCIALTLDIYSQ